MYAFSSQNFYKMIDDALNLVLIRNIMEKNDNHTKICCHFEGKLFIKKKGFKKRVNLKNLDSESDTTRGKHFISRPIMIASYPKLSKLNTIVATVTMGFFFYVILHTCGTYIESIHSPSSWFFSFMYRFFL